MLTCLKVDAEGSSSSLTNPLAMAEAVECHKSEKQLCPKGFFYLKFLLIELPHCLNYCVFPSSPNKYPIDPNSCNLRFNVVKLPMMERDSSTLGKTLKIRLVLEG